MKALSMKKLFVPLAMRGALRRKMPSFRRKDRGSGHVTRKRQTNSPSSTAFLQPAMFHPLLVVSNKRSRPVIRPCRRTAASRPMMHPRCVRLIFAGPSRSWSRDAWRMQREKLTCMTNNDVTLCYLRRKLTYYVEVTSRLYDSLLCFCRRFISVKRLLVKKWPWRHLHGFCRGFSRI